MPALLYFPGGCRYNRKGEQTLLPSPFDRQTSCPAPSPSAAPPSVHRSTRGRPLIRQATGTDGQGKQPLPIATAVRVPSWCRQWSAATASQWPVVRFGGAIYLDSLIVSCTSHADSGKGPNSNVSPRSIAGGSPPQALLMLPAPRGHQVTCALHHRTASRRDRRAAGTRDGNLAPPRPSTLGRPCPNAGRPHAGPCLLACASRYIGSHEFSPTA